MREEKPDWLCWLEELESEALKAGDIFPLQRIADRILNRAYLKPGDTLVDLGAGMGLLTMRAARAVLPGGKVYAVDSSRECLDRIEDESKTVGPENVIAVEGSLESLPLEDRSCDAAICRSALSYVVDLRKAAGEIRRVLVEGGRFSAFEPLLGELQWNCELEKWEEEFRRMEGLLKEARAPSTVSRSRFREALELAGLQGYESLVVHYLISMEGRSEEEIKKDYLFDLPGELAAKKVLVEYGLPEDDVEKVAAAFAKRAARGGVSGVLPCIFIWGERRD